MKLAMDLSIVMPCYNSGKYLKEALASFLAQKTHYSLELIVVVDPSNDNTHEVLAGISDPRVHVIYNSTRLGLVPSRKLGIASAEGRYIGFLDADDQLEPTFAETMLNAANKYDADVVNCSFRVIREGHRHLQPYFFRRPFKILTSYVAEKRLLADTSMRGFLWSKIYRKRLLGQPTIELPLHHMFEDMPLNFGYFAKANRIVSLPKALYRYRKAKSPSLTTSNRSDRAQQHLDSFALIRIFADRSGDPRLVTIVRHSAWRIKLSLLYDIHLSKKAGLSKPEVKRIRRDLALLGKKSPLPVEAKAWSYLLLDSPH